MDKSAGKVTRTKRKSKQLAANERNLHPHFLQVPEQHNTTSQITNQQNPLLIQDEKYERATILIEAAKIAARLTSFTTSDEDGEPPAPKKLTKKQRSEENEQLVLKQKQEDEEKKKLLEKKNKLVRQWQRNIHKDVHWWLSKHNLQISKKAMNKRGVLLISNLLSEKAAKVLNTAMYLLEYMAPIPVERNPLHDLVEISKISGKYTMVDVEQLAFKNVHLKDCKFALDELVEKLQRFLGENWKLGDTLSFLSSGRNKVTTKQYIRADSYTGKRYHGLLVLSDEASPTIVRIVDDMPEPIKENISTDKWGRVEDKADRIKIRQNFAPLLLKKGEPTTIEDEMHPVSESFLKKGDVVLFRSDVIHRGPASFADEDRRMMFFTLYETSNPECQSQLHSCYLGELLYGRLTENQFELIHNTMEEVRDVEPELHTHLFEFDREVFEKWEHIKYNITHTK